MPELYSVSSHNDLSLGLNSQHFLVPLNECIRRAFALPSVLAWAVLSAASALVKLKFYIKFVYDWHIAVRQTILQVDGSC